MSVENCGLKEKLDSLFWLRQRQIRLMADLEELTADLSKLQKKMDSLTHEVGNLACGELVDERLVKFSDRKLALIDIQDECWQCRFFDIEEIHDLSGLSGNESGSPSQVSATVPGSLLADAS